MSNLDIKTKFDLSGQVVILTGAAGLLGASFADGLSQLGANVVLADVNYAKCMELADNLRQKYSVDPLPIKTDITNKKSIQSMVSKTVKKFGKIDVLINNAVYPEGKKERTIPFEKFPLSYWNKILSTNVTGVFLCCQAVGPIMLRHRHGIIINISSMYGVIAADQRIYGKSGVNSTLAYGTTKSAILNLTRYLASYWQNTGIRINTLTLGGVENNQDPKFIKNYSYKTMLGRMAHQDEYVGAILFLASDASSYMTGSNLVIDGGWTAW